LIAAKPHLLFGYNRAARVSLQ